MYSGSGLSRFNMFYYRATLCERGNCWHRVSVCPSVMSKVQDESSWLLLWRLLSTYPTLCCKEILVSPTPWALHSGTLPQTPDLENFATSVACLSCCQQISLLSTVKFLDETCVPIDESWLFTTSLSTVTLYNSIAAICCEFVVQLVSTVDKILTDIVRRAVRLR